MDKEGNFYTENYRGAKAQYHYICSDGVQTWHPSLTFYGFRYIRINDFPGGIDCVKPENFTAITVHSNMKRTGFLSSSNTLLNQLFSNIIWGQKGNFQMFQLTAHSAMSVLAGLVMHKFLYAPPA